MTDTPRSQVAEAREILGKLRPDSGIGPSTPMYGNLTQRAIGLTLLAISGTLDEILGRMEPATIPGLPRGYTIDTQQTGNGNRNWRYTLTGPGFAFTSRYRWGDPETALTAGIRHARDHEQQKQAGLTLVSENGDGPPVCDNRVDVYGIANPEAD
jgi:hypothetical protein